MSTKARPEWADRLERLRQTLGISQAGLARRLHVSAMAPSRWERGINEPPAEIYIQLGKMVGEPACWYFWEKAGLKKSDVLVAVGRKRAHSARAAAAPVEAPPPVQIVPSSSLRNVKTTTPMCAVPLYRTYSTSTTGSFVDRSQAEVIIAPRDWCKNPDRLFCIRTSGEKMAPCLRDGYIVAVDESQTDPTKLDGKMIVAQHPQRGLVVHWFQRMGRTEMLVPENREFPPIYLAEGGWTMLGKVVWWIAKAP